MPGKGPIGHGARRAETRAELIFWFLIGGLLLGLAAVLGYALALAGC